LPGWCCAVVYGSWRWIRLGESRGRGKRRRLGPAGRPQIGGRIRRAVGAAAAAHLLALDDPLELTALPAACINER